MKNFELYLTDDQGRRIALLNNIAFMNLSRATRGYGTIHLGIPFLDFKVFPYFLPDRRVEVWRAPRHGATLRDEGVYILRKMNVYTREQDNVQIIEFWGRSPIDILRRGAVTSTTLADYQKTDEIDDMMKDIVQDSLITPAVSVPSGEMTVDGSDALGPSITHSFFGQNILDILNDLRDISFTKNDEDSANKRIYFDVVRGAPLATGGFGFIFRTYADLRGTDRRKGPIFSIENGNVRAVSYYEDHLDSFTQAQILNLSTPAANGSATSPDATLSRWNTIISTQQTSETDADVNDSKAFAVLQDGKADNAFNGSFVDSPGSDTQPRSLYGVDWDLGDLLPVRYADKDLSVEVKTVYISIDEDGGENIVGMGELVPVAVTPLSYATITLDSISNTNTFGGAATAKTVSHTLGSGDNRIVIAGIHIGNAGGFSPTPTYNGVPMNLALAVTNGTFNWVYIYYLLEADLPVPGTYNLSVDPVTAGRGGMWCLSLNNVSQIEATGSGSNTAAVASWTTPITTITDGAWCVDVVGGFDRTFTVDAGQTERFDFKDATTNATAGSTKPVSNDGATTLGWTPNATSTYAHAIIAVTPAILETP